MKATRVLLTVIIISLFSINVHGQGKKAYASVGTYTNYPLWVDGLKETVTGKFKIEYIDSDKLEEFYAVGSGIGSTTGFQYEVSSVFSNKYHGENLDDYKFTQELYVYYGGVLILQITRMYQVRIDEFGNEIKTVEKDDILDLR